MMGCVSSTATNTTSSRTRLRGVAEGIGILEPITSTARRLSMRPHSLETRIVQVEQVDAVIIEPTGSFLEEAPFVDGGLGLRDLTAELSTLPPGTLFVDPDFSTEILNHQFESEWLRLQEMDIKRIWASTCKGNIVRGMVEDAWLVEALNILALRPELLDKVLSSEAANSKGLIRIRLWRFGSWKTILMDDRLPVGICCHTSDSSEVWPAVVEKAFAKLHGSYAALAGGDVLWALEDLTGGISQRLHLPEERSEDVLYQLLFRPLRQALLTGALVACHPNEVPEQNRVKIAVVGARRGDFGAEICVRARTFNGSKISNVDHWLGLQDFASLYSDITVTTLRSGVGQVREFFGRWEQGRSAGGSRNNLEKFATNPQYLLTVGQPDDPEEDEDFRRCSILIALMQEHRRSNKFYRPPLFPIACFVYKAEVPGERLTAEYFLCTTEEASTGAFVNRREVNMRLELDPGNYVVIPAVWKTGQHGAFLLRAFALKPFSLSALPGHVPLQAMLPTWVPAAES